MSDMDFGRGGSKNGYKVFFAGMTFITLGILYICFFPQDNTPSLLDNYGWGVALCVMGIDTMLWGGAYALYRNSKKHAMLAEELEKEAEGVEEPVFKPAGDN